MPYEKTSWQNEPSMATPLSAANLNNLETQYEEVISDMPGIVEALAADPDSTFSQELSARYAANSRTGTRAVGVNELVANVLDYGAVPDGATDSTAAIQSAINAASLNADAGTNGVVYLPPGRYAVTTLIGKSRVTLRGAGRYKSIITALASSEPGLIQIDAGAVQAFFVEDILLGAGAANVGQHGMYMYARAGNGRIDGGWWYGGLRRVRISSFDGHGIWLRGGGTDYLKPIQFLSFELVESFAKASNPNSRSMLISGQVGQITFNSCQFDGDTQGTIGQATSVEIKRETDATGTILSDASAYALTFVSCTFQANAQGLRLERASGNAWIACWFEDLLRGASFNTSAEQNVMIGCSFSDAGADGSGTGYCVSVGSTSNAHLAGLRFAGAHDRGLTVNTSNGYVTGDVGYSTKTGFFPVTGMTKTPTVSAGAVELGRSRTVILTGGADLSTVTGKFVTGELIHLRAQTLPFNLVSGGNLSLGGRTSPVTVATGACATFVKMDTGTVWQMVSLSGP